MKVCIPVSEYRGLDSPVYAHFGSAGCFVLVDTETMKVECLSNRDRHHEHGACSPLKALAGAKPDAVLVGGIGLGALMGLRQAGIAVYRVSSGNVADAIQMFKDGKLEALDAKATCAGGTGRSACHCPH